MTVRRMNVTGDATLRLTVGLEQVDDVGDLEHEDAVLAEEVGDPLEHVPHVGHVGEHVVADQQVRAPPFAAQARALGGALLPLGP